MEIIGFYNEFGYEISTDDCRDGILYQAGNHTLDSQQNGTGTKHQLDLQTVKAFCEQTTREMADEKNADYGGIEYRQ